MKLFNKLKNKLGVIALVAMLFQITMPVYQGYVYAQEDEKIEANQSEAINDDKTSDIIEESVVETNEDLGESDTEDEGISNTEIDNESVDDVEKEEEVDSVDSTVEKSEEVEVSDEAKDKEESNTEELEQATILREPGKIAENIIDKIKLKYKDGTDFKEDDLIGVDEDLRFELDWLIANGHDYIAGDFFEFQLPEQITVYNPLDGSLGDYGTYTVDTSGNVKFTFNEKVEEESDINGTFWFDTELKESKITSTEETIDLVINGDIVDTIIVNVKPTAGQAISKNGQPVDGNFNTEEVEWTVIVNTTRESLKNAIIDDPILAGQELIIDSLKLTEVEVDLAGKITKELDEVIGFTNNSTKEHLNIELGNTNKAYKLTFKTKLLEKDFKEGTTKYENTSYLKSDGIKDAQAGGSVSVSRPKSMEKTSSVFDKSDRSVKWTVNANFTEQNLKKDDIITDEFTFTVGKDEVTDVFEIRSENISIKQVDKFDNKGKAVETSNAKELFDITVDGNKVTYKLKEDSNKAFILKYKTELKDGAYINKDGKITNKIDLNGKTSSSSQGVYQQVGKKTNAGINYEDKTIDWTITVNADKQDLRNFVLTDSFAGTGQKLVTDSIKITPNGSGATITPNADKEGFKIDFGDIKDTYTIKYQTKFTYDFEDNKKPNFKNGVKISYETSDGSDYDLEFGNTVKPNETTKSNGAKNGNVNQDTKEITWTVDINYNQLDLTDAKVTDAIPDNQSLIDSSVKVYETSIAKKGGITVGNDVTDQFEVATSENQVNVDFGAIDKSYRIEFKTKDKDGIYNSDEKYTNTAKFIPRDGEVHNLTANVTLPNQGEFIGKTGSHNKEDWTIDWKVDVNKSLSTTSDFTVTDDLGDPAAQILLEDTIKVTKAGSTEELEEGKDYKLTVEGNKFEIYFPGEITEAYELTYSSYIIADETVDVKNEAEIQSNDVIKGTTEKTETVNIRISTGGGTGEGTTGGLTVEKYEADSERPLKDIAFSLIKTVGNKEIVVREGTTDDDGKLEWKGLKYGKYTLKEVIPEGYLGEAEREVELSSKDPKGVKTLAIENERETGTARIIKIDSSTKELLEGAEFTLENQTTKQKYTFKTDSDGVILEEIPFGEYTVKEIFAPEGYRITKDIPTITIEIDKTTTIEVEDVAFVDVEGQKTWLVDDDKELPEDITVELLADGKNIAERKVTKDNNWKYSFKNLDKYNRADREIKYEIKEQKVPGYVTKKDNHNLINIQTINISGTKTWKDDNTPDRPSSITIGLFANGVDTGETFELTSTNNWEYNFAELPKYDKNGENINYTIEELAVDGYRSEIKDFDIINTRESLTSIRGEKIWLDEEPTDRPSEITVELTREVKGEVDQEFSISKTVRPSVNGKWRYEFVDLDEFNTQGVAYDYQIKELGVPKEYKSKVDGYDITNIRVGTTEVSGTKRWKDDKVTDRPKSIKINLLRNNVVIETADVSADENWEYKFTDLDKYDEDGKYYEYSVKEEQVPGYAPEITGNDITNTRSEKTSIEITKGWLDDDSENRPESIIVYVYQNDKLFDTVNLKASEDWVYTLNNIEAYDTNGQAYTYTVKEKTLDVNDSPDQYETTIDGFNITNLRVGKIDLTGEKIWVEADSQYRPDSITVNLLANGQDVDTVEVSGETNWRYTFKNLDQYDDQGKEIDYSVEEIEVPGYESSIKDLEIKNKQITTELKGQKTWEEIDEQYRPDSITVNLLVNDEEIYRSLDVSAETNWEYEFTNLPKYDTEGEEIRYKVSEEEVKGYQTKVDGTNITNTQVTTELKGKKIWKEVDSQYRPDSITVNLLVNGEKIYRSIDVSAETDWEYVFTNLPKYDKTGQEIIYTVNEEEVKGYQTEIKGSNLVNSQIITELKGEKIWDEVDSQYRPDSITINLLVNDEEIYRSLDVSAETDWKYEFTDLPKYDAEGTEISYTVVEEDVKGYLSDIKGSNIINKQIETEFAGEKIWVDDNNSDRPDSITLYLLANGERTNKSLNVTAANNWKYKFSQIPKYDTSGKEITYTVEEKEIPGYETTIEGSKVTNLRVGLIDINGQKLWKDEEATDRPASIEVILTRDLKGERDDEFEKSLIVKPNAEGNWTYSFKDLAEFDENGVAYNYKIEEKDVPEEYKSIVQGYNITNLRIGKTEISGTKRWKDDNVSERPDKIDVHLLRNNVVVQTKEITADENWNYAFTDLDEFDENGKSYKYSVKEGQVPGYVSEVNGTDITNTRSEKTSLEITKGWLDDNNPERPDSIIVYVYQNDKHFDTIKLSVSEDWVYELEDLEAYDEDGQPYLYTIKEKDIKGYETTIIDNNLTNLRVGKTEVTGEKIWHEMDSQYRPDSITVNLLANNERIDTVEVSEETNWRYAFENLEKYDSQGKEIKYIIEEDQISAGYESSIEGHNIINTQIGTELAGEKVWLDGNNPNRPDSIKVNLLANGEKTGQSLEVTEQSDWEYKFTGIPKYDTKGKEITYSVEEENVKGYETIIKGTVITNLRTGITKVTGEKIWKDEGRKDRPDSIEVKLTREVEGVKDQNFKQIQTVKAGLFGKWKYTFNELPEFDENGVAYTYQVEENKVVTGYESTVDDYNITNLRVGKTNLIINKIWKNDQENDRPNTIQVDLLQNGKEIETIELSKENNWSYQFTNLEEFDTEGKTYNYTIKEHSVDGYETSIVKTKSGFDIINTYITPEKPIEPTPPEEPTKPETPGKPGEPTTPGSPEKDKDDGLPQTGEANNTLLYVIGSLFILVGLGIGWKKYEQ